LNKNHIQVKESLKLGLKKPKPRELKSIPDFADKVNDIIWQLVDLFFGKKKRYVNPGMTEAEKYVNG